MGLKHPFNNNAKLAGSDWLAGFKKRNPQLSIRAPEATSIARAAGFNKPQVQKFFDVVRSVLEKSNIQPDQIYNIDETGINSVPVPRKILAKKEKKHVGRRVSTERGFNVTAVCGISAAGSYVSPFFLFPRQRMNPFFMKGCSPGADGYANGSGWMDSDHFIKYLDHFINHVKPGPDKQILLILDNHNSHRTLAAINKARENNIIMVSLPPHTSHRLQPLDCTVFGSLKHQYPKECDLWHTNNPGSRVSLEIFSKAFLHTATLEKAIKGCEEFIHSIMKYFLTNVFCQLKLQTSRYSKKPRGRSLPKMFQMRMITNL
ncbi:jerky protein homolog-like [Sitophilus oryzae]|uniref:Jerky protein homolog-like n=1 Tax=Sitophilus oryzae TaxID=7048 RepID=A0A6J2Y1P1_SITOR|nr:jerky protein homolog-like [Sitophilus oryzae]